MHPPSPADRRPEPQLRLRTAVPDLVDLPWLDALETWSPADVPFRDVPVGPSRHLVRFVHVGGRLWALKELPGWAAEREYAALIEMERRGLPAVRAAGLAVRPDADDAVLITEYLAGCWQYRRLLMRIPLQERKHRQRLFDAVALLVVDLHRRGIFWGDCSLANILFKRDGPILQAHLVDAETAELHAALTPGQRDHDLAILEENIGGGLMDLAARLEQPEDVVVQLLDEAHGVTSRYRELWDTLHAQPTFPYSRRHETVAQIRRLNDLGFAVEEVQLVSVGRGAEQVRLNAVVADRRFHADELERLTGLRVGEGQAQLLINDLRSFGSGAVGTPEEAQLARTWVRTVFEPAQERLGAALPGAVDLVQAYCDLLEVRWLLSERAGHDVGDGPALEALRAGAVPPGSAAQMAVADPTSGVPRLRPTEWGPGELVPAAFEAGGGYGDVDDEDL
jgi:tRNA A-37 threonylcarbamoyl transferase component Bud32